jgi:plasmid stability protein
MARMIQIRHVPDQLHRRLKSRAATLGLSLSDYLRRELERASAQLTPEELRERLEELEPVDPGETAAAALRAERGRDARR